MPWGYRRGVSLSSGGTGRAPVARWRLAFRALAVTGALLVAQASAFAQAPPPPWRVDLVTPSTPPLGGATFSGGAFTIQGDGPLGTTAGTLDRMTFVHQFFTGDLEITARVAFLSSGTSTANTMAGVMIRDALPGNGRFAMTAVALNNQVRWARRVNVAAVVTNNSLTITAPPVPLWVRLRRIGATYYQYFSLDGRNWTLLLPPNPPTGTPPNILGANVLVGLCVTSTTAGVLATASIDNVTIRKLEPSPDPPIPVGTGTGVRGEYWNLPTPGPWPAPGFPDGPPNLSRVDPMIDFNFAAGSPGMGVNINGFVARWSGSFEPRFDGEYEFFTETDDGCRLWVDGELVLGSWITQALSWRSGRTKPLIRGWRYNIVMEYFENNTTTATARLRWASESQALEVVPRTQLYSAPAPIGGVPGPNAGSGNGSEFRNNPNADDSVNDSCVGSVAGSADRTTAVAWAALAALVLLWPRRGRPARSIRGGLLASIFVLWALPAAAPAQQPPPGNNGVLAEYWQNPTTSAAAPPRHLGWPGFPADPVPLPSSGQALFLFERVEPGINFTFGTGAPPPQGGITVRVDDFMIVFKGFIRAPQSGTYTLRPFLSDGCRLWFNERLIHNFWTNRTNPAFVGTVTVNMDRDASYPFRLEYYEDATNATIQLFWRLPGSTADVLIPPSAFFTVPPPPPASTSPGLGGGNPNGDDVLNDKCSSSIAAPAESAFWLLLALLGAGSLARRRR